MADQLAANGRGATGTTRDRPVEQIPVGTPRTSEGQVWGDLGKASFAIISYVTPLGEPRSSGVVYAVESRHIYCAVAPKSWKARQISDGQEVAVTVVRVAVDVADAARTNRGRVGLLGGESEQARAVAQEVLRRARDFSI